jgi:hypothetical protein
LAWTDPDRWPGGPIQVAKIDRPFDVGAKVTTKVKGNRPLTSTVTRIEAPRLWVGVAKAPGVTMTIDHVIEPIDSGVVLTERLTFSGPLAGLLSRLMGRRIEATFAATTAHGAEVAEGAISVSGRPVSPGG